MNHAETITRLIRTLVNSQEMHALLVEGPAGWGKSSAVHTALTASEIDAAHLGSYSTPLHFFNFLYENQTRVIVMDDCAGLFGDAASMAILKAATWNQANGRVVRWGSTGSKPLAEEFSFTGKLIIVCNSFPNTPDALAVRSRGFPYKIDVGEQEAKLLLKKAAENESWFSDTDLATQVSEFLDHSISKDNISHFSYRTLRMGYELAVHNPQEWPALLSGVLAVSNRQNPKQVIQSLKGISCQEQIRSFQELTGLRRRSYFYYRKKMALGTQTDSFI